MDDVHGKISRRHVAITIVLGASGLAFVATQPLADDVLELTGTLDRVAASHVPGTVNRIRLPMRDNVTLVSIAPEGLDPSRRDRWWLATNNGQRHWAVEPQTVMTPEMFVDARDSEADAVPAIQSALEFLARHGEGTLRLQAGKTYRLATWVEGSDVTHADFRASIAFPPGMRGITIDLNSATLIQACDAMTFGALYRLFNDSTMQDKILSIHGTPQRGSRKLRLAEDNPLKPGEIVMLVSHNTTPRGYTPIAEMLEVTSIYGSTVEFGDTIVKDHSAAGDVRTGLINISQHHIRNCALIGPGQVINNYRRAGMILQALGFRMSDVEARGRGGFGVRGRRLKIVDCKATLTPNWSKPIYRPYAIALDTGTSHATITNFHADGGDNIAYLHLHEGLADITVTGLRLQNGKVAFPGGNNVGALSILSVSQDVVIDDAVIVNNPQGPAIVARRAAVMAGRGNAGLVLRNIRLEGTFSGTVLIVDDDNPAELDGIDLRGVQLQRGEELMRIAGGPHQTSNIRMPPS